MDMQIAEIGIAQWVRRRRRQIDNIHHRIKRRVAATASTAKIRIFIDQPHLFGTGGGQRQQSEQKR